MKKFLLIVFGLGVVLFLAGGGAFYYYVYQPFVGNYLDSFQELAAVVEMNEDVTNQAAYEAPSHGELTAEQVDRFVQVHEQIKRQVGDHLQTLDAKYNRMEAEMEREGRQANYREVLGAFSDLSGILKEAKRAQVDALNAQRFSVDEYRWVRTEMYRAAGYPIPSVSLTEIVDAAKQGGDPVTARGATTYQQDVPETNRQLVEPHTELLNESAALAWVGL